MANSVMRNPGFLVVMVDWNDGSLVPISHVDSQELAEDVMAETHRADNDAVVYVIPTSAYAR